MNIKMCAEEYRFTRCKSYTDRRILRECTCTGRYERVLYNFDFVKNVIKTKKILAYVDDIKRKVFF